MVKFSRREVFTSGLLATGLSTLSSKTLAKTEYNWKMLTCWPKNFPGLGGSANRLAKRIEIASNNRIKIKVYGAGEIVPAYEVFDAVRNGIAEMSHDSPYYWLSKHPATSFFSTVPSGLSSNEQTSWIIHGGGQQLWDELYERFGLKGFPAGNAGLQMLGWYRKKINSLSDLKGLKIRMSGMHAEVLNRLGATTVNLPGGEVMTSLQSGVIDGVEWGGPWMDLAFGFYKIANFCYGPGLHEPGANFSLTINKNLFDSLPEDVQAIINDSCLAELTESLAEFNYQNAICFKILRDKHNIQMLNFPEEIIKAWIDTSKEVIENVGYHDEISTKIYNSWKNFRNNAIDIAPFNNLGFLKAREKYT